MLRYLQQKMDRKRAFTMRARVVCMVQLIVISRSWIFPTPETMSWNEMSYSSPVVCLLSFQDISVCQFCYALQNDNNLHHSIYATLNVNEMPTQHRPRLIASNFCCVQSRRIYHYLSTLLHLHCGHPLQVCQPWKCGQIKHTGTLSTKKTQYNIEHMLWNILQHQSKKKRGGEQ